MADTPYARLEAFDSETGDLNAVVETPQGSRNKYKYDPEHGLFTLDKVLPAGAVFPFDFGFIPRTMAEDGDPVDVVVLIDEPAFAGCYVPARLVGVIEATQQQGDKPVRNDRIIAVAVKSQAYGEVQSLDEVGNRVLEQIEHFFVSYHELEGTTFTPIGRAGPEKARRLVDQGTRRYRTESGRSGGGE